MRYASVRAKPIATRFELLGVTRIGVKLSGGRTLAIPSLLMREGMGWGAGVGATWPDPTPQGATRGRGGVRGNIELSFYEATFAVARAGSPVMPKK
jgi:hypothetical protein